jgi:hypothetical protein
MLPAFFLGAGLCCWIWFQLRRWSFLTSYRVPHPFGCDQASDKPLVQKWHDRPFLANLKKAHVELLAVLESPMQSIGTSAFFVIAFLLVGLGLYRLWTGLTWPVESKPFNVVMVTGFALLCAAMAFSFVHVRALWHKTQALHKQVMHLPGMVDAFNRLPQKVRLLFGRFWSTTRPRLSHLTVPVHQAQLLASEYWRIEKQLTERLGIEPKLDERLKKAFAHQKDDASGAGEQFHLAHVYEREQLTEQSELGTAFTGDTQRGLQEVSIACAMVLSRVWWRLPVKSAFGEAVIAEGDKAGSEPQQDVYPIIIRTDSNGQGGPHALSYSAPELGRALPGTETEQVRVMHVQSKKKTVSTLEYVRREQGQPAVEEKKDTDTSVQRWLRLAEDFVAMELVAYVSQFIVQIRNLVTMLTICALLLLMCVTSYPFQPQALLLMFTMAMAGTVVVGIVVLLVQTDRDELISRVAKTTPHRLNLDWEFIKTAAAYVLPVLIVVLSQFPEVGDFVGGLMEPLVRALSR